MSPRSARAPPQAGWEVAEPGFAPRLQSFHPVEALSPRTGGPQPWMPNSCVFTFTNRIGTRTAEASATPAPWSPVETTVSYPLEILQVLFHTFLCPSHKNNSDRSCRVTHLVESSGKGVDAMGFLFQPRLYFILI